MPFVFSIGLWAALIIIIADIFSKYWVHTSIPIMSALLPAYPYGGLPIFKNFMGIEFSITHLTNRGAAWGTFGAYQDILLILRIALILGLIIYIVAYNRHTSFRLPLCLVLAGAIGNVIDYFLYGHVVDMFHFILWGYHFPVFNVADSAVCVGITWLLLLSAWHDLKLRES